MKQILSKIRYLMIFIFVFNSKNIFSSIKQEFFSPIITDALTPVLFGSSFTLGLVIFEDDVVDPVQKETVENKPLGRFSTVGDIMGQLVPNIFYTGAMYLHGTFKQDQTSMSNYKLMLKATLYASALTTALKYIIREPRPNGESRLSFPSGHTTTAFAFASVVAASTLIF